MNQSQSPTIICNSLKAREKSRVHGVIGFWFYLSLVEKLARVQPRSQGLSSLASLVVGTETLVAAGHVTIQNLGGRKVCRKGGATGFPSRLNVLEYPATLRFWMDRWSPCQPQPGERGWRESFKPITKSGNRNRVITFDSHLKTALYTFISIRTYLDGYRSAMSYAFVQCSLGSASYVG